MAIIVSNKNKAAINSSFTPISGLCRESTIVINNDGTVQTSGILNLGNKGDKNVTILNIDTSALNWQNLVGENLKEAYQPILVFKNQSNATDIQSIEFEGNYFIVPESIADKAVVYDIIYTLKEKLNDRDENADDDDNDTEFEGNVGADTSVPHREVFVSAAFQGVVHPSFENEISVLNVSEINKSDTNLLISSNDDYKALHKPLITIDWIGKTGLASAQKNLGFKLDSLITPIEFKNFPAEEEEEGNFTVFFYRSDSLYKYVFNNTTSSLKMWVPKEVTEKSGEWKIGIKFENDSQTAVSNSLSFIVWQNFLTSEDLNEDSTQESSAALLSSEGEILNATSVDEDGNVIYSEIQTFEVSGSSYNLSYTGAQVNSLLGWINTNKDDVDNHIGDTNIHVTLEDKALIADLGSRLEEAENKIADFDQNVVNDINQNKVDIKVLQSDLQKAEDNINDIKTSVTTLNAEDVALHGRINLAVDRLNVAEVNIQTNTEKIAGIYSEVTNLNNGTLNLLNYEIESRIDADKELQTLIEATNQNLATTNINLATETSAREVADSTLDNRIAQNTIDINNTRSEIQNMRNDSTIIRNDSNIAQTFVAKIIFLSSEAEYQTLVDEGKIEANTLYLIQEEEE